MNCIRAITADELADDSVDTAAIQDTLTTNKYQDASVTNEKLADIDGGKILDGTITGDR